MTSNFALTHTHKHYKVKPILYVWIANSFVFFLNGKFLFAVYEYLRWTRAIKNLKLFKNDSGIRSMSFN